MVKKPRVVVTNWVQPEVIERLGESCEVIANPNREPLSPEALTSRLAQADAVLAFMPDRIDEAVLARAPKLRMVSCCLKGFDNFDIGACTRRGVLVSILPDLLTDAGAELAIGLMISAGRHVLAGDAHVRSGNFRGWRPTFYGTGLAGSAIGIVGFGAVGRSIAERLKPFRSKVLYWDKRRLDDSSEQQLGVSYQDCDALLSGADFVVLALALTPATMHFINASRLAQMKRGAILVNFARGSLVDEAAVAKSLAERHLGCFAADVFEFEDCAIHNRPREINPALLAMPDRTLFTPHLGSAVARVREQMALQAAENILAFFEGRVPAGALNAEQVDLSS